MPAVSAQQRLTRIRLVVRLVQQRRLQANPQREQSKHHDRQVQPELRLLRERRVPRTVLAATRLLLYSQGLGGLDTCCEQQLQVSDRPSRGTGHTDL